MEDDEIDWTEIGYENEDQFLEEFLGLDENYTLEDFLDSYNPDW